VKIVNYFLTGDTELEKLVLRRRDGGTAFYPYNVFISSVGPFIVMILWSFCRKNRKDLEARALLWAYFFLILVGKFGLLSKAPPVFYLIQLALLRTIQRTEGKLTLKSMLVLVPLVFSLTVVSVLSALPDLPAAGTLDFLYYRLFDIPNEALVEYFAAIPYALPHNWEYGIFGSLRHPPGQSPLATYFLVAEVTRGSILSTSNVMFVGDAWADYAWIGIIGFSFTAGFLVRGIDLFAGRRGRKDGWACIVVGCLYGVLTLLTTSLTTAMVTGGLVLVPIASLLFSRPGTQIHNSLQGPPLSEKVESPVI
jgi:hypothetical protein